LLVRRGRCRYPQPEPADYMTRTAELFDHLMPFVSRLERDSHLMPQGHCCGIYPRMTKLSGPERSLSRSRCCSSHTLDPNIENARARLTQVETRSVERNPEETQRADIVQHLPRFSHRYTSFLPTGSSFGWRQAVLHGIANAWIRHLNRTWNEHGFAASSTRLSPISFAFLSSDMSLG